MSSKGVGRVFEDETQSDVRYYGDVLDVTLLMRDARTARPKYYDLAVSDTDAWGMHQREGRHGTKRVVSCESPPRRGDPSHLCAFLWFSVMEWRMIGFSAWLKVEKALCGKARNCVAYMSLIAIQPIQYLKQDMQKLISTRVACKRWKTAEYILRNIDDSGSASKMLQLY